MPARSDSREKRRALFAKRTRVYFEMLTQGCGSEGCDLLHCASATGGSETPNAAAAAAILLAAEETHEVCWRFRQQLVPSLSFAPLAFPESPQSSPRDAETISTPRRRLLAALRLDQAFASPPDKNCKAQARMRSSRRASLSPR